VVAFRLFQNVGRSKKLLTSGGYIGKKAALLKDVKNIYRGRALFVKRNNSLGCFELILSEEVSI